ncbi:hypothetical protein M8J77_001519 [Diaphorina citri]|nr:hypothetical protein M8J77_001519 [Diaphorina citri]
MESQIEEFLEQFKLSSAKVMEEYEMKRSSYSGLSMTEDATTAGKSSEETHKSVQGTLKSYKQTMYLVPC